MNQKLFQCLLIAIFLAMGAGCNHTSRHIIRSVNSPETAVDEHQDDMPRYFAKDFYLADSGEALPINVFAAELIEFIRPATFQAVAERADVIVIGKPLESLEESDTSKTTSHPKQDFSITDFRVEGVAKGSLQTDDVIKLGQYVSVVIDENYALPKEHKNWNERTLVVQSMDNYRPVQKDSTYILFLYKRSDTDAEIYFPVYESFGRVNVDGTDELREFEWFNEPAQTSIRESAIALYKSTVENPEKSD